MRRGDRVHVAGEVEVDVLHGRQLGVPAARASALHAKDRSERRFADRDDGALAEPTQPVGQADRGGGFTLARRGRRHRRHEHERAVGPAADSVDHLPADLRLVASVGLEVSAVQSERLADRLDRLELHGAGDVDVLFSHYEVLMWAASAESRSGRGATPGESHGIGDRVRDRRRRANRSALAHPLDATGGHRRGRLEVTDLEQGQVVGPGKRVVHQGRGEQLAAVVVDDGLEERLTEALGDGAVDLSLDDHRVDHAPTIFHERIASHGDASGGRIDLDDRDVDRAREGRAGKVAIHGRLQTGCLAVREAAERR